MSEIKAKKYSLTKKETVNNTNPTNVLKYEFAEDGNKYNIANDSSSENAVVSAKKGFPAVMSEQIGIAGGTPVSRLDFNSAINYVFKYISYFSQGGLAQFNSDISKINGYQKGAVVIDTEKKSFMINLVDNNVDKDTGWFQISYKDIIDINGEITFNGNTYTTLEGNFVLINSTNADFTHRPDVINAGTSNNHFATLGDSSGINQNTVFNKDFMEAVSFTFVFNKNLNYRQYNFSGGTSAINYKNVAMFPNKNPYFNSLQNSVINRAKNIKETDGIDFLDYNASYTSNTNYTNIFSSNFIYTNYGNCAFNNNNLNNSQTYISNNLINFKHNDNNVISNLYLSTTLNTSSTDNFSNESSNYYYVNLMFNFNNKEMQQTDIYIRLFGISYAGYGLYGGARNSGKITTLKCPIIQCNDKDLNKNFYLIVNAAKKNETNTIQSRLLKTYDFKNFEYLTYKNTSGVYDFRWKNLNLNPDSGYSILPSYNLTYADNDIYVITSNTSSDFVYVFNHNLSTFDKISNIEITNITGTYNNGCIDPVFYDYNLRELDNIDYNYQIEYYTKNNILKDFSIGLRYFEGKFYYISTVKNASNNYNLMCYNVLDKTTTQTNISISSQTTQLSLSKFKRINENTFLVNLFTPFSGNIYLNDILLTDYNFFYSSDFINFSAASLLNSNLALTNTNKFLDSNMYFYNNNILIMPNSSTLGMNANGVSSTNFPINFNTSAIGGTYFLETSAYNYINSYQNTNSTFKKPIYTTDLNTYNYLNIEDFDTDWATASASISSRLMYTFFTQKEIGKVFLNICSDFNNTSAVYNKSITYISQDGINYTKISSIPAYTSYSTNRVNGEYIYIKNGKVFKENYITNTNKNYLQVLNENNEWVNTNLITSDWSSTDVENCFYLGYFLNGISFFDNTYFKNVYYFATKTSPDGATAKFVYSKTFKSTDGLYWEQCNIKSNKFGYITTASSTTPAYNDTDKNKVFYSNQNCYMPSFIYKGI